MRPINFQLNQLFYIPLWLICLIACIISMKFAFDFMISNTNTDKILLFFYVFIIFGFFSFKISDKIPIIKRTSEQKIGTFMAGICLWLYGISLTMYKLLTGQDPGGIMFASIFVLLMILNALFYKRLYNILIKISKKFKR